PGPGRAGPAHRARARRLRHLRRREVRDRGLATADGAGGLFRLRRSAARLLPRRDAGDRRDLAARRPPARRADVPASRLSLPAGVKRLAAIAVCVLALAACRLQQPWEAEGAAAPAPIATVGGASAPAPDVAHSGVLLSVVPGEVHACAG